MKDTLPARARLGAFEVNLRIGELRQGERAILLQEQPFQILRMLIERDGEIVTREEIKKKFWPNDTVVEFDHSINAAIMKLRRALDEAAGEPRYIQTMPRRGYRLLVPVEWIVAAEDPAGEASAPIAVAANAATPAPLALGALTGRTVSHYRVLDVIGGGGMGVVYRAEDLKLGRAVALKFLPEELGSDAHALERFGREARAASSLNHLNICTIYEFGEHEGRPFIVMEWLQGETLRDRLATPETALSLEELLDIATQVTDGLQVAHERGIIHRDIKPANIFLTTKGVAKILDFGLAKLLVEAPSDQQFSPTNPNDEGHQAEARNLTPSAPNLHLTRTGSAMGTAGYMSPEQIRGEPLDPRTDLFSIGLVLYEMATGQRAFSGQTAEIVREAILHQPQIPVHDLNSKLPPELETIINKALEKDRQARYQTAAEMGADLRRQQRTPDTVSPKPSRQLWPLLVAAALAMVLIALGLGLRWFKGQPTSPGKKLTERLLTHNPAENRLLCAAISPDGKYLAYTDPKGLHLSVIESGDVHDVPLPEEVRTHLWEVGWFPDGEKLIFLSESASGEMVIWVTSIFGGTPRKLRSDAQWPVVSPDGAWIAFINGSEHEVWLMQADGENAHKILADANDVYSVVAWSPAGQRLAFIRRVGIQPGASVETLSLNGGPASVVIASPKMLNDDGPSLVWLPDGRILYTLKEADSANFWAMMADPVTGKPSGGPTKVTDWDGIKPWSATASSDGKRFVVVKFHIRDDVYAAELKERGNSLGPPVRITVSESEDSPTGWMRDNQTILFSSNRTGKDRIFRQQIGHDKPETLITGPDDEDDAELSPDGRWILYWAAAPDRESSPTTRRLMRRPVSGGSAEQVLEAHTGEGVKFDCSFRPDGRCVYSHKDHGQLIFYALDPVEGLGKELARTSLQYAHGWSVSPDGSRLAVSGSGPLGNGQLHVLDFRKGTERNVPLPQGWHVYEVTWTADGEAVFAAGKGAGYFMARLELDGRVIMLLDRGRNQALEFPFPSPDGHRLAYRQQTWESNAWLLENF